MSHTLLHQRLAAENSDLFAACLDGPFVSGLADGSLPAAAFREYLAQDSLFVRDYLAATATAVMACADHSDLVRALADLLIGGLSELASIERDAVAFGANLNHIQRLPATEGFSAFLTQSISRGRPDLCVITLAPCLELYGYIGRTVQHSGRVTAAEPAYRKWFAKYASESMQDLARGWQRHVDAFGSYSSEARALYRAALTHERDFFLAFTE
jgi:thiaminase/transcriptional activator TenA